MLRQSALAAHAVAPIPLDYCGANTQGSIEYMFQMALNNEFLHLGMKNHAVTLVTQTLVDKKDPVFQHPTKPIGSYMDEETAKKHHDEDGWAVVEDAGRSWRRVVVSPKPVKILQQEAIVTMARAGYNAVCTGDGGIPVIVDEHGSLVGVDVVIDKDLASALLAATINADLFMISTEVEKVAINFNKPHMHWLDRLTVNEARQFTAEGILAKAAWNPRSARFCSS